MFESLRLLHTAGLRKRGRDDEETGSQEHRQAVGGVHSLRACLRRHGVHAPRYTILIDSTYFFFALPTFTYCSISFVWLCTLFVDSASEFFVCLIRFLFTLHTFVCFSFALSTLCLLYTLICSGHFLFVLPTACLLYSILFCPTHVLFVMLTSS